MLRLFSFENYKSFRGEATFSMQAAGISEFTDSVLPSPNPDKFPDLLPVAAVYGPNGGGKSTLLEALVCLISKVLLPVRTLKGSRFHPFLSFVDRTVPFLLDSQSRDEPTRFEIYFRTEEAEFEYILALLNEKILYESLYRTRLDTKRMTPVMIFERTAGEAPQLGSPFRRAKVRALPSVNDTLPLIAFAYCTYHIPEIIEAVTWFENCFTINYSSGRKESSIFTFDKDDPQGKKAFLTLLDKLGIPIADYKEESVEVDGKDHTRIYTLHQIGDEQYPLPIQQESQGTIKLFSFLPAAICSLNVGGVMLVDELDAKLHPQLLRAIIRLYTDPKTNPNHAQLIFTSQDVSSMRSEFLRRDEIWFAARDEESASSLWCLYDLQDARGERVKTTTAYDKQYLEGRYGADPYLKRMMDWRAPNGTVSQTAEEK